MEGSCSSAALVRKGAWTQEEDILLKKCIVKFGEGKWHLVPFRAGLNRCRKSCRLRWMNYLKPDIKRGKFSVDEVDLILRLHKLLGNRWSLIAGRIPGRTANDVKNYWNTHMRKKALTHHEKIIKVTKNNSENHKNIIKTEIIRTRPRAFKPQYFSVTNKNKVKSPNKPIVNDMSSKDSHEEPVPVRQDITTTNYWWETINSLSSTSSGFEIIDSDPNNNNFSNDHHIDNDNNFGDRTITAFIEDGPQICWTDFVIDLDLWDVTTVGETK